MNSIMNYMTSVLPVIIFIRIILAYQPKMLVVLNFNQLRDKKGQWVN